ncbi:LiaF transmembrane domain-containing protein [Chitinophaga caeni]|nr:DUF5668 domain-containing protein [Chitinophaga caeni]
MEDRHKEYNYERNMRKRNGNSSLWGGLVLVLIGLFLILKRLNLHLPDWLFSWEMILIVIGVLVGLKNNFKGSGWLICIVIGAVFMLHDVLPWWPDEMRKFTWPLLIVLAGVLIIVNGTKRNVTRSMVIEGGNAEDYINATAIFGAANRNVMSKSFKGGQITAIFGGVDVNFNNADFEGEVVLDIFATFGGVDIVVPANWEVVMEVKTLFGGVDDKRQPAYAQEPYTKRLIITGNCTFGGIELKSY